MSNGLIVPLQRLEGTEDDRTLRRGVLCSVTKGLKDGSETLSLTRYPRKRRHPSPDWTGRVFVTVLSTHTSEEVFTQNIIVRWKVVKNRVFSYTLV